LASASVPGELVQTEFGSGLVRILQTRLLDAAGEDVDAVKHGDPLVIRFDLEVNRADIRDVSFVLGFTRHGTSFAVNVVNHTLSLPTSGGAVVEVRLPAVRLGSGTWFLRVGIAEANVFKQGDLRYFALEDRWYHLMREGIRFDVLSVDQLDASGCFMVHDGQFVVRAASDTHESSVSGHAVNS
jgi:Wzt C-terminal domain